VLTDGRLFSQGLDLKTIKSLDSDIDLAERVDAFVSRLGRLQDTLGDKLLPALLGLLGESLGPAIDNLDKAERFGWIVSTDDWQMMRRLRNQMVHEYIEEPQILVDALMSGHGFVPLLQQAAENLIQQVDNRLRGSAQHRG
jgi:hypothetical protein